MSVTEPAPRALAARAHSVFVSDFVHLDRPFVLLAPVLADEGGDWLAYLGGNTCGRAGEPDVVPAFRHGETVSVLARLEPGPPGRHAPIVVTSGPPLRRHNLVSVPVVFAPTSYEGDMPRIEGDLELTDLGNSASRLSLSARYVSERRPFGLGAGSNGVRRAAEATLRSFLLALGETLSAAADRA